jgi:sarcosine oxidase subunit beta
MRGSKIVIIGGGVVGASVAYHLAARGERDVLILERERLQGAGSTGKATGGVRAQFGTDINIKMSLYSIGFFRDWEYDCGYDPKGYLFFATDEAQFALLKRNVERQTSLGISDVEIIGADEIARRVRGMNCSDIVGGTFRQADGFIDPLAVMRAFTEAAAGGGAKIELGANVLAINAPGGRVRSVTTAEGEIECDAAVLCSGAWAKELAATAGIDLPVEPQKRQIVWGRTRYALPAALPMVIDACCGFHFRPAKDRADEVLFAYPSPNAKTCFDTDFDESFIGEVYECAEKRARFLSDAEVMREKCRAGLYENTPDHHAIIGECDVEGLFLANGFSGHGVMHSPATGRAIAEMILDGKANFLDLSCLSLDRFAKGELLHEAGYI